MSAYQAVVTPSDGMWAINVLGVGWTQALTCEAIPEMAADMIGLLTGDAEIDLEVVWP